MRWLLAVLALVPTVGCYVTHQRSDELDSAARPRVDASATGDASIPRMDAAFVRPDAAFPPSCSPRALDVACTDTGTMMIPVGRPYELPVRFGDGRTCFCGEELACAATVRGRELRLDSVMCAELLCDGCFPYVEGRCSLPPMEEGTYRVVVNGMTSFELEVSDATPVIGPVDQCVRAPVDTIGCGWEFSPSAQSADELCHAPVARVGEPIAVDVRTFCLPCGALWGPCQVIRTATSVRVIPFRVTSSCDVDCDTECSDSTTVCTIPPLEPGKYELRVDGLDQTSLFTVSDEPRDGRVCVSVPED